MVPGVTYYLWLGKGIPYEIRRHCSIQSVQRYVFMVDEVDLGNVQRNLVVFQGAKKVGALATRTPGPALPLPWPLHQVTKYSPKKKAP